MDGLNAAGFNPVSTCTVALPEFSPLGYLNLLCKCFRSPSCYQSLLDISYFLANCKSGSCCSNTGFSHKGTAEREAFYLKVVSVLTMCWGRKTWFHTGDISPVVYLSI